VTDLIFSAGVFLTGFVVSWLLHSFLPERGSDDTVIHTATVVPVNGFRYVDDEGYVVETRSLGHHHVG
jgi:hypothetical protein